MQENKIVFLPSGRLGNALFRYMACAVINIKNPSLGYCLRETFIEPSEKLVFYAGLDHEGDDIRKTNSIFTDIEPKSVAYNTIGYYKHTVDVDNLKSNKYINIENGHGIFVKTTISVTDENFFNLIRTNLKYFNILMDGYFQFAYIYLKYKAQIIKYMQEHKFVHYIETDLKQKYLVHEFLDDTVLLPEKIYDIVIHIRLDDFKGRPDYIEENYYMDLFQNMDFTGKKTCLLFEATNQSDDHLFIKNCAKWFSDREIPIALESNSLLIDFNIMKQATVLVCSMSTLSWIAAYLSTHIQTCYMPNYNFNETADRRQFHFKRPIENTLFYNVKTTISAIASIKSYIVTLPHYPERWNKLDQLCQQMSFIGIEPLAFNGVYGKDIQIESTDTEYIKKLHYKDSVYTYDSRVRTNKTIMSRGELGCAWSHLNLLKQLLTEAPDINYYLILEDDVELVKSVDELFKLLQNIPADADICHLAKSDWFPFIKTSAANAHFHECVKTYFNRTTAYLISKKGAKKVLAYSQDHIDIPIDDLYCTLYRQDSEFRFYVPSGDFFFREKPNTSSIIHDINQG